MANISKLNIPDTNIWAIIDATGHTMMQIVSKDEPTEKFVNSLLIKPK